MSKKNIIHNNDKTIKEKGGKRLSGGIIYDTESPVLSVITVVYNNRDTIEQTIQSVLNQTYKNIEYLIVDGGSTDGTLDVIKKYDGQISYWHSEPDNGIYDAMNKGIRMAIGDYICLLNADDWFDINAAMIVADEIRKCEIAGSRKDIYYAMARVINSDGETVDIQGATVHILNRSSIAHQTCFVSKEIYSKSLYDTSYKSAADYDFFCRMKREGAKFHFIEKIIVNYRLGGMSDSAFGLRETYKIRYKNGYIGFINYLIHESSLLLSQMRKGDKN